MYEPDVYGIHRNIAGLVAAAIVAVSGLIFDRAHLASAPEGTVEVGQLEPAAAPAVIAALPDLVVTAKKA